MEKIEFKNVNLAREYDAIEYLNHNAVFMKMKCIYESPLVESNWDYINALFTMADSVPELMLGLIYIDEFPHGQRYEKYRLIRAVRGAMGYESRPEYIVRISKHNPYGWFDDDTFKPNVRVHKFSMLRMVHNLFRKNNGISLIMALENLQSSPIENYSNWESMAMLVMNWDDICRILGLETEGTNDKNPFIHNVSLN